MRKSRIFSAGVLLVLATVSAVWAWDTWHKEDDVAVPSAARDAVPPPATDAQRIGRMVYIEGGTFRMGNDFSADADARPAHDVFVDPFYIDEHEVTNRQFARFVDGTNYCTTAEQRGWSLVFDRQQQWVKRPGADWRHPWGPGTSLDGRDDYPVVHVSWHDAVAYARWSHKQLPTEAQWEYAARSGLRDADYPWGRDELTASLAAGGTGGRYQANYYQHGKDPAADGFDRLAPVKSYPASPTGLYDVSGNACEWCADGYDADYYRSSPMQNPPGPSQQQARVHRGGSYLSPQHRSFDHHVYVRAHRSPEETTSHVSFRCVRPMKAKFP
ncbi:MAG: formylglycine-generating enzyme family protein [Candidatus Nealsonbacteria bacterium]|nr:formylglycine-generating enzyme family protein [Candidatus Nealsonbacteria bacterium]